MEQTVERTAGDGQPVYGFTITDDTGSELNDWIYRGHIGSDTGPLSGYGYITLNAPDGSHVVLFMAGMTSGNPAGLHYSLEYPVYDGSVYGVSGFIESDIDDSASNINSWWPGAYTSGWEDSNRGIVGFG